uniref:Uncharacterized protein n=1 Tax=Arundo donax TaxID=35708 RepID=A0A0A9G628_ARUDO
MIHFIAVCSVLSGVLVHTQKIGLGRVLFWWFNFDIYSYMFNS